MKARLDVMYPSLSTFISFKISSSDDWGWIVSLDLIGSQIVSSIILILSKGSYVGRLMSKSIYHD